MRKVADKLFERRIGKAVKVQCFQSDRFNNSDFMTLILTWAKKIICKRLSEGRAE